MWKDNRVSFTADAETLSDDDEDEDEEELFDHDEIAAPEPVEQDSPH